MGSRRQFKFDDPEDSYWNDDVTASTSHYGRRQSSVASSSFFDDNDFESATTATSDIFGATELSRALPNLASTSGGSGQVRESADADDSAKWIDVAFNDLQSLSDKSSAVDSQKEFGVPVSTVNDSGGVAAAPSIISDCSIGSRASELTVHLDYARLKGEHRKLQKHFETIRSERFKPLPVAEAVRRLAKCQPISLDLYRTREEKVALLEAALSTFDHDVVSTVILFLKRTLSNAIFREILIMKPAAADCYVEYLRECNDTAELVDTLFALGRSEDAAMVEFEKACRQRQPSAKLNALKKCLVSGFSVPALENEAQFVRDYIATLE